MKKIILAATVLASLGFAATAQAGRDDDERDAWFQTMRSVPPPAMMEQNRGPVIEGRNAATVAPRHTGRVAPHIPPQQHTYR